ncbi:serine hydrolase [Alsobacter sp. SYSU BS001988]
MVATASLIAAVASSPAEARRRHHGHGGGYNPPYAAMALDAKTGRVLHAENEDALRHPASVTKVMTLYLLFEQLEKGRFTLETPLRVSAHAAAQAPSKLGLRPGSTIEVEDAIKALVTKSANDVAAAVAENIGGSESAFADMMTRKARQIGMSRTTYRNASGLPNPGQVTTARDLITLARSLQDRFPRYYRYFSTPSFTYAGASHRNHNHLLGRVEGMDGIKTGYTRASGFNLLTSVRTEGRHVVAVVLGGRSASSRDRQMVALLDDTLERAYAGARTAPPVGESTAVASAEPPRQETARQDSRQEAARQELARLEAARKEAVAAREAAKEAELTAAREAAKLEFTRQELARQEALRQEAARNAAREAPRVRVASVDDAVPMTTSTVSPRSGLRPPADVARSGQDAGAMQPSPAAPVHRTVDVSAARPVVASALGASTATPSSGMRWVVGAPSTVRPETETRTARLEAPRGEAKAEPKPEPKAEARADRPESRVEKSDAKAAPRLTISGWVIQLGATDEEDKAKDILARAKASGRFMAKAAPFTEKVNKDGSTLYRARFSGFDEDDAQSACRQLKRSGFSCFAVKG